MGVGRHLPQRSNPTDWSNSHIEEFMRQPIRPVEVSTVDHTEHRHPQRWDDEEEFAEVVIAALYKAITLGHAVEIRFRSRVGG